LQVEIKTLILAVEINGEEKRFKRGDIIDLPKAKVKQLGLSVAKYVPPITEDEDDEEEGAPAPTLRAAPPDTGKGGGEPPGKKGK
jgi:hypothetical protein